MAAKKRELHLRRRLRNRNRLRRSATGRLRLSVFRSNKNISVQLIDDARGATVASASSMEGSLGLERGSDSGAATAVGTAIAERALKVGVEECYFDRGGFLYHGRVKALAEAARAGGLKF